MANNYGSNKDLQVPGQYPGPGQMTFPQGYVALPVQGSVQDPKQPYNPPTNIQMSQDHPSNYGSTDGKNTSAPRHGDKDQEKENFQLFSDNYVRESVRRAFIRKVYTVLTLQLLFTTAVILTFVLVEPVKKWLERNRFVYIIALVTFMVVYLTLICFERVRRKYPTNYICLFILTVAMSCMTGIISSTFDIPSIFMAFGMTAALTLCITLFAIFTKIDFTKCYAFLIFIGLAFVIFAFACVIYVSINGPNKILLVVYAGIGLAVSSIFLCFETQLIVGGRFHEYSEEDYIVAVVEIYLDIIQIFIYMLQLIQFGRN